jgi:CDP-glucose 4,6-dehydratase
LWLHRLGAHVRGFALPPDTSPNLFEAARVASHCDSIFGDVRRPDELSAALSGFDPDIVLHLAAQSLVQRSYRQPVATYQTNVMGTINLLEAVRDTPAVRTVVIVTTDKCYENQEWAWAYRENEPLGGYDPYSSSKACVEILVAAWRRSFLQGVGVAVATARAGNVIGGGDWAEDRLIPDCIRALASGKPILIRNPYSTRPWQHVLEPLAGYLSLAERLSTDGAAMAEAWNFSGIVERFQNDMRNEISEKYSEPLMTAVAAMPRQELVMMAEVLVSLTAFRAHASVGEEETAAGPIDVAISSKSEGFVWVKRKQFNVA